MSYGQSGIRVGRAFVEMYATTAELHEGLRRAELDIRGWVTRVGLLTTGLGATILAGFMPAINAAANTAEKLSAFEQVFRGANEEADRLVDNMSNRLRRSAASIAGGMTSIGAMVRGLGLGADEAAHFSAAVVQAGLDISSFYNEGEDATFARLRSALSGSSEAVDQFGINLRAEALKLKLTELGFEGNIQKASELEKTLARLSLIQDALARQGAAGDLERTADSYSNMSRSLRDAMSELLNNVGIAVLPIAQRLQIALANVVKWMADFAAAHPNVIRAVAALGFALTVTGAAITAMGFAATTVMVIFGSLTFKFLAFGMALSTVVRLVPILGGALAALGSAAGYLLTMLGSFPFLGAVVRMFTSLAGSAGFLTGVMTTLYSAFAAVAAVTVEFWAPILLVVAAVAAFVAGLYALNEYTGFATDAIKLFGQGWDNLKHILTVVWELLARFEEPLGRLGEILNELWQKAMRGLSKEIKALLPLLTAIATVLGETFLAATEVALGMVVQMVEGLEYILTMLGLLDKHPKGKLGGGGKQPPNNPGAAEPDGFVPLTEEQKQAQIELQQFAELVIEQTQTPMEKFAQQVNQLNAARKSELITQEQYNRALQKARADLAKDTEDPRRRAMIELGERITEQQLTAQERYRAEVARLTEAVRSGTITQETYRRAVAEQDAKLQALTNQEQERIKRIEEQARNEKLQQINDRGGLELKRARATGDELQEFRAMFRRYQSLLANGFEREAAGQQVDLLGAIISSADRSIEEAARARDGAAFVSTSGGAATAAGLGANAINENLLQRAEKAERDRTLALEKLDEIKRNLE